MDRLGIRYSSWVTRPARPCLSPGIGYGTVRLAHDWCPGSRDPVRSVEGTGLATGIAGRHHCCSYFVALRFREPVSQFVHASPPWNVFVAMLVLYVGTSLVIWIVFRMVSKFIDRMKLKEFDRQIGAMFGFAKGLLLCVLVTLFAVTLLGETQRQTIVRSRSGNCIAQLLDKSSAVMPREVHEVLDPYINRLDEQLQPSDLGNPFDKAPALPDVEETLQTWLESNPATAFTPSDRGSSAGQ